MDPTHKASCIAVSALMGLSTASLAGDDPFADVMVSYDPGVGPAQGYLNPLTTLGSPERFTGEGVFPSVVSAFSPPFGTDEIVSIGAGGQLTVQFNTPVTDDPDNLHSIDLLIFGNTGFIDSDWPNGIVGGVFGNDGGIIEVSSDGKAWHQIAGAQADDLFPTIGYVDSGPYDASPGRVLTDFTRPLHPELSLSDFLGLNNSQVIEQYRGSGGGVGIDLARTGLAQITHVRIINPSGASENIEIDAFSDVAPRIPGDVDLNGIVNVTDLLLLIGAWGDVDPTGPPADFNNDGFVNVSDLLTLIAHWSA